MGNHENGSAVPRFASQPFRDQAHILPVKAAGGLIENQYPAAGKDGAVIDLPAPDCGSCFFPIYQNMSPCLPCQPTEDLRKGGFPRAVLSRYGGHFAFRKGEENIIENDFLAYSFREPCCPQDGRAFAQYGGNAPKAAPKYLDSFNCICYNHSINCISSEYSCIGG